jgi:DHA1 family tetracycline resistance protein-like MFS transporter
VLPGLVREFTGGDFAQAAWWVGTFGTLFAAIQFVSTPIQGTLSDRYGRRPVILLSCLGLGVDFMLMALAQSLPWLLVARVFSGMFSASFTTANAYLVFLNVTAPHINYARSIRPTLSCAVTLVALWAICIWRQYRWWGTQRLHERDAA